MHLKISGIKVDSIFLFLDSISSADKKTFWLETPQIPNSVGV